MKAWVCASAGFDLVGLTKAMLESFTRKASGPAALEPLQQCLRSKLSGQRFLLVLDDVWGPEDLNGDQWETFCGSFYGCQGGKIIITTESLDISKKLGAPMVHGLPLLKNEDCLQLFKKRAFAGKEDYARLIPEHIQSIICEKCRGLPLAAIVLGNLLRGEPITNWADTLNYEGDEIMKVLDLSYLRLPLHLRRCFRYCAAFPKGYRFNRNKLVRIWIAHGLVPQPGNLEGRQMEDIGAGYFDALLSRSFFQPTPDPEIFLLHDLILDLAKRVSTNEYAQHISLAHNSRLETIAMAGYFRSISFTDDSVKHPGDLMTLLQQLRSYTRRIRVLDLARAETKISREHSFQYSHLRYIDLQCNSIREVPETMVSLYHLQALDLSNTGISSLPDSVAYLLHLRYLGLRGNQIGHLPESLGSLHHLQTIDLWSCPLSALPSGISKLCNLRHLIHGGCFTYASNVRNLTNLRTMPGFKVSTEGSCAKLGELRHINRIRSLMIEDIHKLTVQEAEQACLRMKTGLTTLTLRWGAGSSDTPVEDVLKNLQPPSGLEVLKLYEYPGTSLPSWLEDQSFNVKTVELYQCKHLTSLPSLGNLPLLEHLCIKESGGDRIDANFFCGGFSRLEKLELTDLAFFPSLGNLPHLKHLCIQHSGGDNIDRSFFTGGFKSLETLKLDHLREVQSWCGALDSQCPLIQELTVADCPKLKSLSLGNLSSLKRLEIQQCPLLRFSPNSLQLSKLPSLEYYSIKKISSVECILYEHMRTSPDKFVLKLVGLGMVGFKETMSATEKGGTSCIKKLFIASCGHLTSLSLGKLNALEYLDIGSCEELRCLDEEQLPPRLQHLKISGCPRLENWYNQHSLRLQYIKTRDVPPSWS